MKLSEEDKREIIRLNREEGVSQMSLTKMYNVNLRRITDLLARYDLHGEEALIKGPYRTFPPEFKLEIVKQYLEGESVNSLAITNNIQRSMVDSWVRRYEKDGYNGLIDKKKGRPPKMKKDKDKINEETDEGKGDSADKAKIKLLENRNRELEAEVAYLKKLKALVQERKKREAKKK